MIQQLLSLNHPKILGIHPPKSFQDHLPILYEMTKGGEALGFYVLSFSKFYALSRLVINSYWSFIKTSSFT